MPRRVALVAVALLLSAHGSSVTVAAADRCLSRDQARKMFPRTHLYWSIDGGQRCWSNRRGRQRFASLARAARPSPPPAVAVIDAAAAVNRGAATPRLGVAGEVMVATMMPPHQLPQWPQWEWLVDARAQAEPGVVYSTFEGEQPDVWPVLREPASTAGGLAVVAMSALLSMVFGLMLARWHWRRFGW